MKRFHPAKLFGAAAMLCAAVAVTTGIILLAGANPFLAYLHIFKGSLGSISKLGHVIKVWIPLTICACGLLYTFKIGLWNIGIEGQMMMGAVFAMPVLRNQFLTRHPDALIFTAACAAVIGGAFWAFLAGFLKTRGGVNEIFAGLGLNFVAQGIVLWLIFGPWKRPGIASMSGTELLPRSAWLNDFKSIRVSPTAFFTMLIAVAVTAVILRYTRIGLSLKAVGKNETAAFLYTLKPGIWMLIAMAFAGGFAGMAGFLQVVGVYHRLIPAISSNYGYLALLVVMVSNYNLRIAPLTAFFFACLNVGSIQLPMMLHIDSSLSGVIQGTLVLAILAVHALSTRRKIRLQGTP